MFRNIQISKLITNHYLVGVVFYIIALYAAMLILTLITPYSDDYYTTKMIIWIPMQLAYMMMVWSMIRCVISDPGKVPIYWGVLMDDQEQKKRRYCLICHIFKPERCHHCSQCQRCVLNMDHHCPWIGNCVGYHNRKFFILFLLYINFTILFAVPLLILTCLPICEDIYMDWTIVYQNYLAVPTISLFLTITIFGGVIANFFYFHLELVSINKTTIDTLEIRRSNLSSNILNVYDIGFQENWLQVMGKNKWLWPFPMFGESGRPIGDGVKWEKNTQNVTQTEQNATNRTQTNQQMRSEISQTIQRQQQTSTQQQQQSQQQQQQQSQQQSQQHQ